MSSTMETLQPPVPFHDFEFSFDPSLNIFPAPPPLPSSAELFSANEAQQFHGFLEDFNEFGGFDFVLPEHTYTEYAPPPPLAPYSNPHLNTTPEPSTSGYPRHNTRSAASRAAIHAPPTPNEIRVNYETRETSESRRSSPSDSSSPNEDQSKSATSAASRSKPLLSTPQKRLNHIMSEQKRRNAIRDGYAQLIALLAPAGSAHGIGMPTRGRPKGSGIRGKGQTKGKSGVLFRAVEYCKWLEEGRDALRQEVLRVEAAAGIRHP